VRLTESHQNGFVRPVSPTVKSPNPMHKKAQIRPPTHEKNRTNPKNGGEREAK
jgi:hypothetical protein